MTRLGYIGTLSGWRMSTVRIPQEYEKKVIGNPKRLEFPSKLMDKSQVSFAIYVPSTRNHHPISTKDFKKRIADTAAFLSRIFGGATQFNTIGNWNPKGRIQVDERIAVVQCSTTRAKFMRYDLQVRDWLRKKKAEKQWGQDTITFSFNGRLYFI